MIRALILVLLATISAQAQDSAFVRKFCNRIKQTSGDIDFNALEKDIVEYSERNSMDGSIQGGFRFQYRLNREIHKTCPEYASERVRLIPMPVFDLENDLIQQKIDSLGILASQIGKEKKAYVYIVTIDDFYPDSTIEDFARRYRDFWASLTPEKKSVIMVVVSITQRKIRIATSDVAMNYLTDLECTEVNEIIIKYLKEGKIYNGLVAGLLGIKDRL